MATKINFKANFYSMKFSSLFSDEDTEELITVEESLTRNLIWNDPDTESEFSNLCSLLQNSVTRFFVSLCIEFFVED